MDTVTVSTASQVNRWVSVGQIFALERDFFAAIGIRIISSWNFLKLLYSTMVKYIHIVDCEKDITAGH